MGSRIDPTLGRRGFLKGVVAAAGAAPVVRQSVVVAGLAGATVLADSRAGRAQTVGSTSNLPGPEAGYQSLSPDEAGFVEAMVNIMCPADSLTPNGVDCGLAIYIDRQLAGGFGKGERLYLQGPWKKGSRSTAISCRSLRSNSSRQVLPWSMRSAGTSSARSSPISRP